MNGGEAIVASLKAAGVSQIFGLLGSSTMEVYDAVWSKYWSEASISSIENLIALITVPVAHRRPG